MIEGPVGIRIYTQMPILEFVWVYPLSVISAFSVVKNELRNWDLIFGKKNISVPLRKKMKRKDTELIRAS